MPAGPGAEGKGISPEIEGTPQHLALEDGEHAMQGPHVTEARRAPALRFGPGKRAQGGDHELRQHLGGLSSRHGAHGEIEFGVADGAPLALIDRCETGRLEETLECCLGCPHPRTLALLEQVRLPSRQAGDDKREAARRHMRVGAGELEACLLELLRDETPQLLGPAQLHACRNLFGEQLEKELGHAPLRPCVRGS